MGSLGQRKENDLIAVPSQSAVLRRLRQTQSEEAQNTCRIDEDINNHLKEATFDQGHIRQR